MFRDEKKRYVNRVAVVVVTMVVVVVVTMVVVVWRWGVVRLSMRRPKPTPHLIAAATANVSPIRSILAASTLPFLFVLITSMPSIDMLKNET